MSLQAVIVQNTLQRIQMLHTDKTNKAGIKQDKKFVQSYYFTNLGPHAKFQNPSTASSGRIFVRVIVVLVTMQK